MESARYAPRIVTTYATPVSAQPRTPRAASPVVWFGGGGVTPQPSLGTSLAVDVTSYGAVGDGVTDSTAGFQQAANLCPDGGTIVVPGGSFVLTSAILNTVGKNLTWVLYGKILDRLPAWADVTNDLTLNGKGVIAFSGGRVAVLGTGKVHFDGGAGVGGVSQAQRHMFYFYNCSRVFVGSLDTVNGLGRAVGTYGCSNITHRDCNHTGGYAPVVHRSPTNLLVDNVNVFSGIANGIGISNRGFLDQATLAWTRGTNIRVSYCYVFATVKANYAVGLTIDSCDNYTCVGNIVDGNNIGTFAYSFAVTTNGTTVGNGSMNVNNVHAGGDLPGGLGMECVNVLNSVFAANWFLNVMCAYDISQCTDSSFDGVYTNVPASTASFVDAAVSSFAQVGSTNDNVRISGVQYGGNVGVIIAGNANGRVFINNLHSRQLYGRFLSSNASPGSAVDTLEISDSSFDVTSAAITGCLALASGVAVNVTIKGFRGKAGAITAGQAFCFMGSAGSRVRVSNVEVVNFDFGFDMPAVVMTELQVRNVDFTAVNTRFNGTGNVTNFSALDLSAAGVPIPSVGNVGAASNPFINAPVYSAAITPDLGLGDFVRITATNGVAFTINQPLGIIAAGQRFKLTIRNGSGGALGAVTFAAIFKQIGFAVANATNGNSTSAEFQYDGANFVQLTPWTVNVPN